MKKFAIALTILATVFLTGCESFREMIHGPDEDAVAILLPQFPPVIWDHSAKEKDHPWHNEKDRQIFAQTLKTIYYEMIPCLVNAYSDWLPENYPHEGKFSVSEVTIWTQPQDGAIGMMIPNNASAHIRVMSRAENLYDGGAFSWEVRNGFRWYQLQGVREFDNHPGDSAAQVCVQEWRRLDD